MNDIKEQFVTYEIALKLKELGFDEGCFAYYYVSRVISLNRYFDSDLDWNNIDLQIVKNSKFIAPEFYAAAPLWQQAQSFLDDNGVIIGIIFVDNVFKYTLNIENYVSNGFRDRMSAIKSATEHATSYLWDKNILISND